MDDAKKHPKFAGNVKAVDSRNVWKEAADSPENQCYHGHSETYLETGPRLGEAEVELLKAENKGRR